MCTADVVDNLFDVIVTIAIRNSTNNTLNSTITGKDSQVSLKLYPLKSSNADQYQCVVIMSQSIIDYKLSQSQSFNISAMCEFNILYITCINVISIIMYVCTYIIMYMHAYRHSYIHMYVCTFVHAYVRT